MCIRDRALEEHEGVSRVHYVSADEAWEEFQEQYFGDNPELAEGFRNDNPLASSDNYEVYMETKDDNENLIARSRSLSSTQNELVEFAQGLDGVREVNKSDVVANTLSSVNTVSYTHLNCVLKHTKIQTRTFLKLIQSVHKSIPVNIELPG